MTTRILVSALVAASFAVVPALYAAPASAQGAITESADTTAAQIPAVGLSYNGERLAWIADRDGTAQLMLGSWTGKNAHAIPIPGGCAPSGLRWAPRWSTLAVMTRCESTGTRGADTTHGSIWIVDVHSGAAPRKIADITGYASGMQWKNTGKAIAFLFRPAPGAKDAGFQVVAAVSAQGGPFQILTPANWYVHAFRLARLGDDMAFTASAQPDNPAPTLYTMTSTGPRAIFDPAKAAGDLHGLEISLIRYPGYLVGFLGRSPGATDDNIYTVSPNGGGLVNRTATNRIKPSWFTMNRHQLIATRAVGGQVQLVKYRIGFSWLRQDRLWFSVKAPIGDGRAPFGVSISYFQQWRRVAFVQSVPGEAGVVRSGLLSTQPPPVVASLGPEVASAAQ